MNTIDPSATASHEVGLFGVPTDLERARVVVIPVPWDVTTSYGGGAAHGPRAVWEASPQIDLFDLELGTAYEEGYHLLPIPEEFVALNEKLRPLALQLRERLESGEAFTAEDVNAQKEINAQCARVHAYVHSAAKQILSRGQIPAVLGGDHSSPEGLMQAISESTGGDFGVLHIDAHADLRDAYQGFERSHASIMHRVMHAAWKPKHLVQVAIRDFSREEYALIKERADITTFFDLHLKQHVFAGKSWHALVQEIIAPLPKQVYISFDIDGLSPEYCPSTGTPVPGGLTFDQANYLIAQVKASGRKIIGFDLNEVAPSENGDEWDGNVGARLLYKLCGWTVTSQPRAR